MSWAFFSGRSSGVGCKGWGHSPKPWIHTEVKPREGQEKAPRLSPHPSLARPEEPTVAQALHGSHLETKDWLLFEWNRIPRKKSPLEISKSAKLQSHI